MNKEELYKLYDRIVSATYINIDNLSDDKIILKNYYDKNNNHRFFLEVACMVAYLSGKEIYLETSLLNILKIRFRKKNKHIHYISKKNSSRHKNFDIVEIGLFEAHSFGVENDIFGEIYEAYYKKGK